MIGYALHYSYSLINLSFLSFIKKQSVLLNSPKHKVFGCKDLAASIKIKEQLNLKLLQSINI